MWYILSATMDQIGIYTENRDTIFRDTSTFIDKKNFLLSLSIEVSIHK